MMIKKALKISMLFSSVLFAWGTEVSAAPAPSMPNYFPVVLNNNSNIAPDQDIYVFVKAFVPNPINSAQNISCYMTFNAQGLGTCNTSLGNQSDLTEGTPLTALPKFDNGYAMYLPPSISGRIYFSIGQPMTFNIGQGVDPISGAAETTLLDPDGFNPRDPDYNLLYDKIEYTFTTSGGSYADATAVDFFSLPLSLSQTIGTSAQYSGLTGSRAQIINQVTADFNSYDTTSNDIWNNLFLNYNNANYGGSPILLRVMSPAKAMENMSTYGQNSFDPAYLSNSAQYGFDYISNLWSYYTKNTISIDCSELENDPNAPKLSNYIFTGQVNPVTNQFVFTNQNKTDTVSIAEPTQSADFFGGSGEGFTAPNNTPLAIIARDLTAAFDVGLLPAANGTTLNSTYFANIKSNNGYYLNNPNWGNPAQGPWYDLYSKAFHSFGESQPIYTFAFDDELSQDGTLNDPGSEPNPLLITIGDMTGTTIPPAANSDTNSYTITIACPSDPNTGDCTGNTTDSLGNPLYNNEQFWNESVPFNITVNGVSESLYFQPQLILPEADSIIYNYNSSNDITVTLPAPPAQGTLGWAAGYSSIVGCGIDQTGISGQPGSASFDFSSQPNPCTVNVVGDGAYASDQATLTVNYTYNSTTSSYTINSIPCTYNNNGNIEQCAVQPSLDNNSNVGIPGPSIMI